MGRKGVEEPGQNLALWAAEQAFLVSHWAFPVVQAQCQI